ncbi:CLUMA_CG020552, isoform A [Clunio marinus]|uniref:CLUMA_CG020552, isoform A n=1 Tax=Clunio marinus TaxID=568069 RepID=A0A1J1J5A2_9DIPT|nr:CLUMA_CG020552, isoform A [Clunio marinus]
MLQARITIIAICVVHIFLLEAFSDINYEEFFLISRLGPTQHEGFDSMPFTEKITQHCLQHLLTSPVAFNIILISVVLKNCFDYKLTTSDCSFVSTNYGLYARSVLFSSFSV